MLSKTSGHRQATYVNILSQLKTVGDWQGELTDYHKTAHRFPFGYTLLL